MHTMQLDWKRSRNIIRSGLVHDPGGPVGGRDATDQYQVGVGDALAEVDAHATVLPGVSAGRRGSATHAARG
jgi:hypothetical protein